MADTTELAALLRKNVQTHSSLRPHGAVVDTYLGDILEKLGNGIQRKLEAAIAARPKKLKDDVRDEAVKELAKLMANKLAKKVIEPHLDTARTDKAIAAKLIELHSELSTITEDELKKISATEITTALANATRPPDPPPRPRPQTTSRSSSSGSWGGKGSWGSKFCYPNPPLPKQFWKDLWQDFAKEFKLKVE